MSALIETLTKRRYQIVTIIALSYLFFQTMSLSFMASWTGLHESLFNRLEDAGVMVYFAALFSGTFYMQRAKTSGNAVTGALKDELVKTHLQRAGVFGYKAVFLITMILFCYLQFGKMDAEDVARIILTAALVAPFLRFAYLEAKHA